MMTSSLTMIVMIGSLLGAEGVAENWPQFRGPTGEGILQSGSPPIEWSATKNVTWKQPIPGAGWSSPVVDRRRIYLTASVPIDGSDKDQSLQALCLDATSGKSLWSTEVFKQDGKTAPRIHGKNSHASPSPIIDGDRLYVHFGHQGTACLDTEGKIVWRNRELSYKPVHGNGGTPILVDDMLVYSADGGDQRNVIALDVQTGKVRWKTKRSIDAPRGFSFSTPLLIEVNGKRQIVSPGSDMVGAYDPDTGREIWKVRYDGYSVIPRPVYGHGLVFISTSYNTPNLLAIKPDGEGDVTDTHVAWSTKRSAPHTPSPLLVGDELYIVSDNGVGTCLDAKTGKVHWNQRLGGNYSASPLFADGRIYFQNETGTGVVIKAGAKFEKLATNELNERTLASYAAIGNTLFIRSDKGLYRIEQKP